MLARDCAAAAAAVHGCRPWWRLVSVPVSEYVAGRLLMPSTVVIVLNCVEEYLFQGDTGNAGDAASARVCGHPLSFRESGHPSYDTEHYSLCPVRARDLFVCFCSCLLLLSLSLMIN